MFRNKQTVNLDGDQHFEVVEKAKCKGHLTVNTSKTVSALALVIGMEYPDEQFALACITKSCSIQI